MHLEKLSVRARLGLLLAAAIFAMCALVAILINDSQKRIKSFHIETAKAALQASLVLLEEEYKLGEMNGNSVEETQERVLSKLRTFRYSNGEGYVAVSDDSGFVLMHPVHEHLNQTNIWDMQDPTGRFIVREAINIAKENGIGVNSYLFEHPMSGEYDVKTSAVGRFQPWGWTLIVGVFDKRVDQAIEKMFSRAIILVGFMSCLFLMLALFIGRSLSRPIERLNGAMTAIASGAHDTYIPYSDLRNESGDMARALSVFRDSGKRILVLQQEKENAQRAIETERQAMASRLKEQFGEVMEASRKGDFSRRVETDFSDANLASLADTLNALIGKVDDGVTAVKNAMLSMSNGVRPKENPKAFEGAFSEMLKQVCTTAATLHEQSIHLQHSALHDALTGLPNRRFFDKILAEIEALTDDAKTYALMHVDLDHFKGVNDSLGHAAGDEILKHTAETLRSVMREQDFVARIGGDEFVVICDTQGEESLAEDFASQIIREFQKPVELDDGIARLSVSVGLAYAKAGCDLLKNADLALYQAKRNGRNQVCEFSVHLRNEAQEKKHIADDILRGLEHEEFVPFFQPQLDAKTREVVGVEALARWQHPKRGTLPPIAFLPIAEEVGLINQIDRQIASAAIRTIRQHNSFGLNPIQKLSLNVSPDRLLSDDFLSTIGHASEYEFRIAIELLESITFDGAENDVLERINAIKQKGYEIEFDDFGTGRASILGLLNVAPDRLKIDRQLVAPIFGSGPERRIVQMIVEIGNMLNIEIIAEGVETLEHAELLRKLNVKTLQGYAFAKPLSANDLELFLNSVSQQSQQVG